MPLLQDEDVGLAQPLSDADVGISSHLSDSDVGLDEPADPLSKRLMAEQGIFQPSQFSSGIPMQVATAQNPDYDLTEAAGMPLERAIQSIPTGINKAMDVAGKGVLAVANLPTTIANKVRGATPQSADYVQPLDKGSPNPFEISQVSDEDYKTLGVPPAVAGVHKALIETFNGLTEPQMALAMPALGLESLSKPVTAAFAAQLAANLPESVYNAATAEGQEAKAKAWASTAIQALMLKASGEHALGKEPLTEQPQPLNANSPVSAVEQPAPESTATSISKPLASIGELTGNALDQFRPQGAKPSVWANPDYVPPEMEKPNAPGAGGKHLYPASEAVKRAQETQSPAPEIPLGLNRPEVENPSLKVLSDGEFDKEYREAQKQVDEHEKAMDETSPETWNRQKIADAQDRWSAADLERFRRNNLDIDTRDIFYRMIDLAHLGNDYPRFKILANILKERGDIKPEDVMANHRELPQSLTSNPDFKEVLGSKLEKFRNWLKRVNDEQKTPHKQLSAPEIDKEPAQPSIEQAPTGTQPVSQPVKPGYVRMYHGGEDPTGKLNDARDITPYLDYAKGYAAKTGSPVWYVDVPADAPYMKKAFEEFDGGPKSPYINTTAPAEVMKLAKKYSPETPAKESVTEDVTNQPKEQVGDNPALVGMGGALDKVKTEPEKAVWGGPEIAKEREVDAMPVDELAKLKHGDGIAYGLTMTDADVPRLQAKYDTSSKEMMEAASKNDQPAMTAAFGKQTFYGGALMGATKGEHPISGSNYSRYVKEHPEIKQAEPDSTEQPATETSSVSPPESVIETPAKESSVSQVVTDKPETQPESDSQTFGIAERVREKMGDKTPSGEGITAEDSVEKGRKLLADGVDPEKAMSGFEQTGKLDSNDVAVSRAYGEKLYKRAVELEDNPNSPEYKAAKKASDDWNARTKKMQTEWHRQGMAQQGETDVDTGSFTSMAQEFKRSSGKDFTPEQAKTAQERAKTTKKAAKAVKDAQSKLFDAMTKGEGIEPAKSVTKKVTEKLDSIADAAWKRIVARHNEGRSTAGLDPADLTDHAIFGAAKLSKGVIEFSRWSKEMVKDLGDYVKPHLKDIYDASKKWLADHTDTIGKGSLHDVEAGKKFTPEQVKALWKRAKDMVDKGDATFDDVRHKLAMELGLPVKDVTEALLQPKNAKRMTDEMYRKMSEHRRIIQSARNWLENAKYPGWQRFIKAVPAAFFKAKVFGHGTVGMITHAGINIFNPLAWKTYWPNFFRQYKLMFDSGYHERMMQDLQRDPLFIKAKRAGLANDPTKYQDDYSKGAMKKMFGAMASVRGFDALKIFRQAQFNQAWNRLPPSLQTPEMAQLIANAVNHATGTVKMPLPKAWDNTLGTTFFAPRLEGSRWMWLIGDTAKSMKTIVDWKKATPEERNAAMADVKQKAAVVGTLASLLAINQGILKASGSSQNVNFTDPKKSDFLSFKVAGHNVGIVAPMIGVARLLANLLHASVGTRANYEKKDSRAHELGTIAGDYTRSKFSPFAGFAFDVASQATYDERPMPFASENPKHKEPYTYGEYAAQQVAPIPLQEAVKEVWKHQGMDEDTATRFWKALLLGVSAGSTGARVQPDESH